MKKFIVLSIVLLVLAGFAITSSAEVVTLWAGQTIEVGTLKVEVVDGNLEVTYTVTEPEWELLETHLYVGKTNPEDLTSAPGQFPYSEEHDLVVPIFTYIIPISEIDSYSLKSGKKWVADESFGVELGDVIYIAAQAEVRIQTGVDPDTDEPIYQEETVWAEGLEIRPDKNWAMYFEFVVPE